MRSLLCVLFLSCPVFASDLTKEKAIAIAKATMVCQEEPSHKSPECTCGPECKCDKCECKKPKQPEAVKVPEKPQPPKVQEPKEKFLIVRSATCIWCDKLEAEVLPDLKKHYAVEIANGGHGATSFPTILFMVDGKEQWRTTGYTSLETLEALAKGSK